MEAIDVVYCFSFFLRVDAHTIICNETHDAENTFKIAFQEKATSQILFHSCFQFLVLGISLSSGTKPPCPQMPSWENLNSCKSLQFTFPVCWQQLLLSNFNSHTRLPLWSELQGENSSPNNSCSFAWTLLTIPCLTGMLYG